MVQDMQASPHNALHVTISRRTLRLDAAHLKNTIFPSFTSFHPGRGLCPGQNASRAGASVLPHARWPRGVRYPLSICRLPSHFFPHFPNFRNSSPTHSVVLCFSSLHTVPPPLSLPLIGIPANTPASGPPPPAPQINRVNFVGGATDTGASSEGKLPRSTKSLETKCFERQSFHCAWLFQ